MGNIFGGERVILVVLGVGLALVKANYECSSEVNRNFNAFEAEVKTASDAGRHVTNILPSSDGLYFYVVSAGTTNVGSPTVYDNTIFEKRSGDSSVSWSKGYQYVVNQRSAALDDAEDYIYFAVNDGTKGYFGKIATADGSVSRFVQTDTGIKNCNGISYSGGYLYAQCTSSASGGTLTELDASNLGISYSINLPNDQMFSVEAYSSSNRNVIFGTWQTNQIWYFSYTFPISSVNYGIDIGCTGGSCAVMNSALSLVLESRDIFVVAYMDDSQIETIITIGLSNGTYVPTAKVQSSAPLYSSSRAIEAIGEYGDDDKIFILSNGGNEAYIIIYDFSEDKVVTTYYLSTTIIHAIAVKYGYLYLGPRESISYIGTLSKHDFHDTFLTAQLYSEVSVTIQSSGTFTAPTSATITINVETGSRTITDSSPTLLSDVDTQTIAVYTGNFNYQNTSFTDITVSTGGKSTHEIITPCYVTNDNNCTMSAELVPNKDGDTSPSWVTLKDDFSAIIVNAPEIKNNVAIYEIGISFTYQRNFQGQTGNYSFTQYSSINLFNWGISNWGVCEESTKDTLCNGCKDGYVLSQDKKEWSKEVLPVQAFAAATTVVVVASAGVAAINAMTSTSSGSSSVWSVVNQYQLYLLFPLLKSYMPADFVYYLTEFEMFNLNFGFLDFVKFPEIEPFVEDLDYKLDDEIFEENGFSSGSFFVKQFQFFKAIAFMGLFNLAFVAVFYCIPVLKKKKFTKKIFEWLLSFFFFTCYIRLVLEAYLFAFISCILEVTTFSAFLDKPVSYHISLVFMIAFLILPFAIYYHFKKFNEDGQIEDSSKFKEWYEEYKPGKKNQLFGVVFLTRRIIVATCIVVFRNSAVSMKWTLFLVFQILYLQYLVQNRPYESAKDNLLEVLNEVIFLFLTGLICLFQTEAQWKAGMSQAWIMIVMINGFLVSIIVAIDGLISLKNYLKQKCSKSKTVGIDNTTTRRELGDEPPAPPKLVTDFFSKR